MVKICENCHREFKTYSIIQKCCFRTCASESRPHKSARDEKIETQCDFKISYKCKITWTLSRRALKKTQNNNNGKVVCLFCSRKLKQSGRKSPNTKYMKINDSFFETINTEAQAYLLGWIASDGSVTNSSITISIHKKDYETLVQIKNIIDDELPIFEKQDLVDFTINSTKIATSVCRWLSIDPGKKDMLVKFPDLKSQELKIAFLRGYFDGNGSVVDTDASKKYPICNITSNSNKMLDSIQEICGVPCYRDTNKLEWSGNNALDFLAKIYDNANYYLHSKRELYLQWCSWIPSLGGAPQQSQQATFLCVKTCKEAVLPSKERASDSGYDLTIIKPVKTFGMTTLYTTGIKIQPEYGWYMDVLPRSSIIKTGYMLANSTGVIDRTYTGEIMIALIKVDPNAAEIELPCRIAQMIPRPIVNVKLVEVDNLDHTERQSGGFGSTGK